VLLGADKERGLRCEMYVLLLQYLLFCRWGPGLLGGLSLAPVGME
jgi:hypothetical protein